MDTAYASIILAGFVEVAPEQAKFGAAPELDRLRPEPVTALAGC